jgi:aspartate 1-decarboxylase
MMITILQSKIHNAFVTKADLNYEGSISIDENLIEKSNLLIGQQVDVLNVNNGERFTTYVIKATAGSGEIQVNGAAARKVQVGDKVIIIAYALMTLDEAKKFSPTILLMDQNNKIKQ